MASRNLNRVQFDHTLVDEQTPSCDGCGEQIQYNSKAAGKESFTNPGTLLNGWHHQDGMKRDHEAAPPFGVSGEDELTRTRAKMDQARSEMHKRLNAQFVGMAVDDVFKK